MSAFPLAVRPAVRAVNLCGKTRTQRALATAVLISACWLTSGGFAPALAQTADSAQSQTPKVGPLVENSTLDAPLFYQLLIGEIQLREGEAGTAYEVMLDAAKRTRDEQLFRRATDIALEARAGEQALAAAKAWRSAVPKSIDATRYVLQILIALNRPNEAVEPLQALVALVPLPEQPSLIASLPRFFGRGPERKQAGTVLEQALGPALDSPPTRQAALLAIGRGWLLADNPDRALDNAQKAQALEANSEGPVLLGLELMPTKPAAEPLVTSFLQAQPDNNGVRIVYARVLATAQRYDDAAAQLDIVTRKQPDIPQPWLTLGALHLELHHPEQAETALKRYVELAQAAPPPAAANNAADPLDEDDTPTNRADALTQAWLMLSQAAEQRGDYAAADRWLGNIDSAQHALDVQVRRATLLAHQGRIDDARALVRAAPEAGPQDARAKLLGEAQVLREVKGWDQADAVLAHANELFPDDADLLYEQAMMAEKLDRMDEMERLLRRVIELKPDYHNAYNALGYSLAEHNMRLPEAKALIERALALVPGEPFITDSLGWVEYRLGNRDGALRLLKQAYATRPDTEIGAHLGEVLWVNGDRDEARRVWRESRQRDGANDVLRETLARLQVDL